MVTNVVVPNYYDRGQLEPDVGLHIGNLRAFVNTAILGTDPQPLQAPALPGQPIRDRRVDLLTARAGIAFTETRPQAFALRLGKLIHGGASVFIPMLSEARAEQDLVRCTPFHFRDANDHAGQASLEGQVTGLRGHAIPLRYTVSINRGTLSLAAGGGFAATLTVVEVSDERLVFVRGPRRTDAIDAYHPDDAEIWFRSQAVCEGNASAQSASSLWP